MYERKTIDLCQDCHDIVRPGQYFPDSAEVTAACQLCGDQFSIVARVRRDECELIVPTNDCSCCGMNDYRTAANGCTFCDGKQVCCRN